jgi:hypothetical protein
MDTNIIHEKKEKSKKKKSGEWEKITKTILPKDIEEKAKELKALERKREVKSAVDMLKVMLIYATQGLSTRMMSVIGIAHEIADISDTAWRKHLIKSVIWLTWLMNMIISKKYKLPTMTGYSNVYVIDASGIKQEGINGKTYRIHMKYALKRGMMAEVKVTDHHTGEGIHHFRVTKDDIYLCDAGYGNSKQYEKAVLSGMDALFRINIRTFSVVDKNGKQINIVEKLSEAKTKTFEINGYTKDKKCPVRIVCIALPEEKAAQMQEKKSKRAKRKGRGVGKELLESAKWLLLATSLDKKWRKNRLEKLYRARWQVELLFKRIKQNLHIKKLRASSEKSAQAVVILWLIAWAITEELSAVLEKNVLNVSDKAISNWMRDKLTFLVFSTILSNVSLFPILCDFSIVRHLADHPRKKRFRQSLDFS